VLASIKNFYFQSSKLRNLPQHLQKVASHAHGRHITTGTCTLDDERVRPVPLGVKVDNVVASLQSSNGVRCIKLLQTDLDALAGDIDAAHKANDLACLLGLGLDLLHLRIELGQLLQELVAAAAGLELLGDQALYRETLGRLDGDAGNTGEDGQLAGHIKTVQVVAGVGLGVSQALGLLDLGRPLAALAGDGGKGVEEEGHGTAEDTLNLGDLVASVNELVQGGDDGQPSTDGRLVVDLGTGRRGRREDILPQLVRSREGLFVGSHDRDTLAQEGRVQVRNILRAGVVDEDDRVRRAGEVIDGRRQGVGSLGRGSEGVNGTADVNGRKVVVVQCLAARGDVDEVQLGRRLASSQALELRQEALADAAGAYNRVRMAEDI